MIRFFVISISSVISAGKWVLAATYRIGELLFPFPAATIGMHVLYLAGWPGCYNRKSGQPFFYNLSPPGDDHIVTNGSRRLEISHHFTPPLSLGKLRELLATQSVPGFASAKDWYFVAVVARNASGTRAAVPRTGHAPDSM